MSRLEDRSDPVCQAKHIHPGKEGSTTEGSKFCVISSQSKTDIVGRDGPGPHHGRRKSLLGLDDELVALFGRDVLAHRLGHEPVEEGPFCREQRSMGFERESREMVVKQEVCRYTVLVRNGALGGVEPTGSRDELGSRSGENAVSVLLVGDSGSLLQWKFHSGWTNEFLIETCVMFKMSRRM